MQRQDDSVWRRETEFHDTYAEGYRPGEMPPRGPDAMETELLRRAGDLHGRRVLDLGCGSGDLTLMLIDGGAEVTSLDISPGMLEVTRRRLERFRPEARTRLVAAPAESTGLEDGAFDLVVGRYVIHHIDPGQAGREIARLLSPQGSGIFIENSGLNPLLRLARERLAGRVGVPRYGTADERPMTREDISSFVSAFVRFEMSFPDFKFFRLADRQLLHYRVQPISRAMVWLDQAVQAAVPPLRRQSFHLLLQVWR